ncbi:MAG: ferritin-like domain-containing protein [Minicystis sp.]
MSSEVRREEQRLRRIFQRALWVAIAVPAALPVACSTQETGVSMDADEGAECDTSEQTGESESALFGTVGSGGRVNRVDAGSCAPAPFTPNPPDKCGKYVRLPCGLPAGVTPGANCYLWLNDCSKVCSGAFFNCHAVGDSCKDGEIVKDAKGGIDIDCATCSKGVGRIPAGLEPARMAPASSALGGYFGMAAHLEAASVHAFRRLRRELGESGAPARLRRAAQRAAEDEVRHARTTGRLARRFGGTPVRPKVAALPARALDVVALENAVEGCVRETFGALVAGFQAANAQDPEIARAMEVIARDETRHAALSWAVARWAARRLDGAARAAIKERCREAIDGLRREAEACVPDALLTRAGLPNGEQQRAMIASLNEGLWRAFAA